MRVVLSAASRRERREAEAYYAGISPRLRAAFRADLSLALQYLSTYPAGAPVYARDVRAKTLRRFPYTVFYRLVNEAIFVLAIVHQARDLDDYSFD